MDPASATVAFVGFAASLASLTGALASGLQQLWTVTDKLKNAPEEFRRLSVAVSTLHALLASVQALLHDEYSSSLPSPTLSSWLQNAEQITKDLAAFNDILEKCCPPGEYGRRRLDIKFRMNKYLNDAAISRWEDVLNGHINKMTLFCTLLNSFRASTIHNSMKSLITDGNRDLQGTLATLEARSVRVEDEAPTQSAVSLQPYGQVARTPIVGFLTEPRSAPSQSCTSRKMKPRAVLEKTLYMTWSYHRFPIGILTIRKSQKIFIRDFYNPTSEDEIAFSLQLPHWLSNKIVEVLFLFQSCERGTTSFKWNLSSTLRNDNATLARYTLGCNISGMQRLFAEKKAQPTDILPSGRSLVHEVVVACISRQPNSLAMLKFLFRAGADPNLRSLDGQTALLFCSKMMCHDDSGPAAARMFATLFPVLRTLIDYGANPIDSGGSDGFSVISYLFSHSIGMTKLSPIIKDHVDISTIDELSQLDTWILTTIARVDANFKAKLYGQLAELRTVPELSTRLQQPLFIEQLSLLNQVEELRKASQPNRIQFMRSLCRQGSAQMIAPLLEAGIDVHEADNVGRTSYLGEAAGCGNHDAVIALLDAGANVNSGRELTAQSKLVWRWHQFEAGAQAVAKIRSELPLLEELIQVPGLDIWQTPELLDLSLFLPKPVNITCATLIANAGFGICLRNLTRNQENPCLNLHGVVKHSALHGTGYTELHAATEARDLSMLDFLLSRNAYLEDEDSSGCTALLAALQLGYPEIARRLVAAGALIDCRSTIARICPREVATHNVAAQHPRTQAFHFKHRPKLQPAAFTPVSLEDDMECFEIIRNAPSRSKTLVTGLQHPVTQSTSASISGGIQWWMRSQLAEVKYVLHERKLLDVRHQIVVIFGLTITILAYILLEMQINGKRGKIWGIKIILARQLFKKKVAGCTK